MNARTLCIAAIVSTLVIVDSVSSVWADPGNSQDVITSGELHSAFQNDTTYQININKDITLTDNIGSAGMDKLIKGSNYTVNGNQHSGLVFDNASYTSEIDDITLKNFSTSGNGGAVNNSGTLSIYNSDFTDNHSTNNGGAIYNTGTVNLVASERNVSFTWNYSGSEYSASTSNAITSYTGKLNLNAGTGRIIFNDAVTSGSSNNVININASHSGVISVPAGVPTSGQILLNAPLRGYNNSTDSVCIYNGTLALGSNGSIGNISARINDFVMKNSSILDLADGSANDTVYVNHLITTGTPSIWLDVNLNTGDSDKIDFSSIANSGTINLKTFHILADGIAGSIRVASGSPGTTSLASTYTNSNRYDFTDNLDGTITVSKNAITENTGLTEAANATGERSFSLTGNYTSAALATVDDGGTLTIFGNGKNADSYYITGDVNVDGTGDHQILSVIDGTVNIVDAVMTHGYISDYGGAIYNNDVIGIYNSKFEGNVSDYWGGAIYNQDYGILNIHNSLFTNNQSQDDGGAIYNDYNAILYIYDSSFTNNYAKYDGSALYNCHATANVYNSTFTDNYTSDNSGVIQNDNGILKIYNSLFSDNYSSDDGGVIYNYYGTVNIYNSTFTGNYSSGNDSGGAIYNDHGTSNIYDSSFTNNYVSDDGGAIYNDESTVSIYNSTFTGNYSSGDDGGAIYNYKSTVSIYNSSFTNNHSSDDGGAIYNEESTVNIYNSTFEENTSNYWGGAIRNKGKTLNINDSSFINNHSKYEGGSIYNNYGTINIHNTTFTGNYSSEDCGGAILNGYNGILNVYNTTFTGNYSSEDDGGAIYNDYGTSNIYDSSFTNNYASGYGGAITINSQGVVNLISTSGEFLFDGNKQGVTFNEDGSISGGISNAITIASSSTLNLNVGNLGLIKFNDCISTISGANNAIININGTYDTADTADDSTTRLGKVVENAPTTGTVLLNADMTGFGNSSYPTGNIVNLYNGTLQLGPNGIFFQNATFNMAGGTLDLQNNKIDNIAVSALKLTGNTNLKIDVNAINGETDNFINSTVSAVTAGKSLNITGINMLSDKSGTFNVQLTDTSSDLKSAISVNTSTVTGNIYRHAVTYDDETGMLQFSTLADDSYSNYNPQTYSAGTAAQTGGYLGALATYNEVLSRVDQPLLDTVMLQSQLGYDPRLLNKTASAAGQAEFSPLMDATKQPAVWFKPFATFENVPLNNGPTVHNVSYGGLIGGDSGLRQLKKGYQYVITGYGGYTGAHQAYDGVSLYQNGGYVGLMGTLYKGDFFTALTANVGASDVSSNNSPDFAMINTGIASKTGYNIRMFNNKVVLQPSYSMSYTFVGTEDYTNNQGVRISTDALNAIQIIPGSKLILNLKRSWQPYLNVDMVWNILDESKVMANDISLPQVSVDPYVEYGIGVQKKWGERFTGFFQSMVRNGGRNGISLVAGFRWNIW